MNVFQRPGALQGLVLLGLACALLLPLGHAAAAGGTQEPQNMSKPRQWLDRGAEQFALYKNQLWRRYHLLTGKPLPGTPDLARRDRRLAATGLKLGAPVFLRLFKREAELELWLFKDGKFHLFDSYPICRFSGRLGPKLKTGDKQAPEGFYTITRGQLNPNSKWYRSFNTGYPNLFDRAHGRTGSFLMVHGGCSSAGCYAMTNAVITEVWDFITAAFKAGQARIHLHAFPFRPTALNMYIHAANRWAPFWRDLKRGYDLFEQTRLPPLIGVCKRRYTLKPAPPGSRGSHPLRRACYSTIR